MTHLLNKKILLWFLASLLLLAMLVYVSFGFLLFHNQQQYLYYPTKETFLNNDQSRYLTLGNNHIKIWVLHEGKDKAIIYFGANAESVNINIKDYAQNFPDFTIYLASYRGYSGSSGQPSEQGFYEDASLLYDYCRQFHQNISVIGRSIGSGVATYLAANKKIDKLVLITPFDSIQSLAQQRFPIYPISLILKDKFDSISWVPKIQSKTLILIAGLDRMVPRENSMHLAKAFGSNLAQINILGRTDHENITMHQNFYKQIREFVY